MPTEMPTDALVGLLLFLIGAPALMYQLVSNDTREVIISDRLFFLKFCWPAIFGSALVIVFYVFPFIYKRPPWFIRWDLAVGILLVLVGVTGFMIFPLTRKEDVVKRVEKSILKQRKPSGSYSKEDLKNLVLLGKESQGGEQRGKSIAALDRLAEKRLADASYRGDQLGSLIVALDAILLEGSNPSNADNYRSAVDILTKIVQSHNQKKDLPDGSFYDADIRQVFHSLQAWAEKTCDLDEKGIIFDCIRIPVENEPFSPAASEVLRDIGLAALRLNQYQVALHAIAEMEQMVNAPGIITDCSEIIYDLLDLLAALWSSSESGRIWVSDILNIYCEQGLIDLEQWIKKAVEHFAEKSRPDLADPVRRLHKEWIPRSAGR